MPAALFAVVVIVYLTVAVARVLVLRPEGVMDLAVLVAVVLLLALTTYAIFGGADFGAGFWDLFAGGPPEGAERRTLIPVPSARSGKSIMCG